MSKETHCHTCGTALVACCSVKGCDKEVEVYSRVVGYFRPVSRWNDAKKEEYKDRTEYTMNVEKVRMHALRPNE